MIDIPFGAGYNAGMNGNHYHPEVLRVGRRAANLKIRDAAEALGVKRLTIYRVETGRHASYELLSRMARLYGVPLESVVKDSHLYA